MKKWRLARLILKFIQLKKIDSVQDLQKSRKFYRCLTKRKHRNKKNLSSTLNAIKTGRQPQRNLNPTVRKNQVYPEKIFESKNYRTKRGRDDQAMPALVKANRQGKLVFLSEAK